MLVGLFVLCVVILKGFPDTHLAQFMRRHLVEWPAERLAKLERRHAIFLLLTLALMLAATEFLAFFGSIDLALAFSWDLALYVDAVLVTSALAAVSKLKFAYRVVKLRCRQLRGMVARRPGRRNRDVVIRGIRPPKPSNDDDEPGWGLAIAA